MTRDGGEGTEDDGFEARTPVGYIVGEGVGLPGDLEGGKGKEDVEAFEMQTRRPKLSLDIGFRGEKLGT